MKIGIFDPYLDDLGGGEKYMMNLASCLSGDHEVFVFWDDPESLKGLIDRFSLNTSKIKFYKNIFKKGFGLSRKLLETRKFDIIIVLSDGSVPLSLSKKTFLHIQQPLSFVKPTLISNLKLKRINKVFCNSFFTKSYIDKELGIESAVLYPPIDLYPKDVKKENIILHVGRFRVRDVVSESSNGAIGDYKKQSVMVKVFKELVDDGLSGWKLVIASSVKEDEMDKFLNLKKQADKYPIEFLINKTNRELWEYYNKSKLYWHASGFGEDLENHPEFAEHFGISTVEAMGAGAVPVVINAGGQREIVINGENGFLWNSIEELKTMTMDLIKNEKLLSAISLKAIKRAQDFAGDRFCREAKDIILK